MTFNVTQQRCGRSEGQTLVIRLAYPYHYDRITRTLEAPKWMEPQMAGRLKISAMKAVREQTDDFRKTK